MKVGKSTQEPYRAELFAPILKDCDGKYIAVLTDDSIDRDGEKLSKGCVEKLGFDGGYIAGLVDHENSVLKQVAEWINRKVVEIDGHTALTAEPKFYKSNPNAKIIQGMLEEGANLGISIGAMVKDYDDIDGMRVFKELEIVEASFVAVPSNRHGRVMRVAKSYKTYMGDPKMDEAEIQKNIDAAVEKKVESMKADFTKQLETKDAEIAKLKKDAEEAKEKADAEAEEAKKAADAEAKKKEDEAEAAKKAAEAEVEKAKKEALEKQKFADAGSADAETVEKSLEEGKLPVMRF